MNPEGLGGLRSLKKLYTQECDALEEFLSGVCTFVALKELNFGGCRSLKRIPNGLGGLMCFKDMWECDALEEFPSRLYMLVALEELGFHGCKSLKRSLEGLKG